MKRIIALLLCVAMSALLLAGCGKEDRLIYNIKLDRYIELGEYMGIKVNTKAQSFKDTYDEYISSDVEAGGFYVQKTEGTVADGDTANIDYEGKKNGVAFDGGTAEGFDLTIGSNSFIDGFEEGLIGKEIGSTVDLNLTFPEDYGSEDLAGQAVVFTVTINYVTTDEAKPIAQFCNELGFKTAEEYEEDVERRVINAKIFEAIEKETTVKNYPKDDSELVYDTSYKLMDLQSQSSYGATLEQLIQAQNMDEEEFKENLMKETVYPEMKTQMIYYAILDEEGLEVTPEETAEQLEKYAEELSGSVTEEQLKETFGEYYFEVMAVIEKVDAFLYKNAEIK